MSFTAAASSSGPADWGTLLESDLRAFHGALLDSHPGPVDAENAAFGGLLEQGLREALERVPQTRDFAGYWWAMRGFEASFNDGHVQLLGSDDTPALETRWPGFLTRDAGAAGHVVATRDSDPDLPPVGARLLDCEGVDANELAADRLGRFHGNWELTAQRMRHGARLLLDEANPWVSLPRECRFTDGERSWVHALEWRPLGPEEMERVLAAAGTGHSATFGLQEVGGMPWIGMPGFDGHPSSDDHAALTALLEELQDHPSIPAASRLVLDVRGNGGGSSHWSHLSARILWGSDALAGIESGATGVDWRVSEDNVAAMRETQEVLHGVEGMDPVVLRYLDQVVAGMREALARGDHLWRERPEESGTEDKPAPTPGRLAPKARVYVLTDSACASACLNALDVWRALGAIQVGHDTRADTLYMDIRQQLLPSGLASITVPMKVYRGRQRGNNEPHVPDHLWTGDTGDDAAIAAWIQGLD